MLLCVLTVLFSRIFFINTLYEGEMPDRLNLIVFFTVPAVMMIILLITIYNFVIDLIYRRPGSVFNTRLLVYFILIVFFSVAPITVMTGSALSEVVRFWQSINASSASRAAGDFIADNYLLHTERFENILRQNNFNFSAAQAQDGSSLPEDIAAVQVFNLTDGIWTESTFTGDGQFRLSSPPAQDSGFTVREMPRDTGTIRYVQRRPLNTLTVINYNLGNEFDAGRNAIENLIERFETINLLRDNFRSLLFYYLIVFFLPTVLMTVIIAVSFTRRITNPIIELTEATRLVAEGDFSTQILTSRDDELGILIRSFNSMVQDLEKSRAALVKDETITLWQNMAQQFAHEVKNPLTPIKLSAERVLRRWRNNPEDINEILESSMTAIINETEKLSSLLNEFRTLSKPIEISQTWTDLLSPVEETINSYSSSYPHVKFDISGIDSCLSVKMDKQRLSQIFTNLIINAIDAMNGSGLIEIRTDLVKKREVCYCRISVKDSGKGISKQEAIRIFTPYYTTKESGTGLGLSIVERIINEHGGAIWFDSAENTGTTFYVDLPAEKKEGTL